MNDNKRVADFINSLYGSDMRRSCLTTEEAMSLTNRFLKIRSVTSDLDLGGYSGKWTTAVEAQIRAGRDPKDFEFWMSTRHTFLAMGGEYNPLFKPPEKGAAIVILSLGILRETIVEARRVKRITPEIVEVDCPECGGDGDWTKFYPEPETLTEPMKCVPCKGTGRVFA